MLIEDVLRGFERRRRVARERKRERAKGARD